MGPRHRRVVRHRRVLLHLQVVQQVLQHRVQWGPMGTTNLRSSQHFHNLQIDQMADRRQKAQDKPGRNILNRPVAGPRGIPTTLWAILDMGRHQEVLTAVLPHLVEAWALRVLVRTAATPGMVWPAPRGSDLRLVLFQLLRRPPGALIASRGFTRWMITPIGGLSSKSCSASWRRRAPPSHSVQPYRKILSISFVYTCTQRNGADIWSAQNRKPGRTLRLNWALEPLRAARTH